MNANQPHASDDSERKAKQEKFQAAGDHPRPRTGKMVALGVGAALILAVAYLVFVQSDAGVITGRGSGGVLSAGEDVRIPLDELKDGRARFFRYPLAKDRELQFFTLKSSDGVYRAAFNACDVCYAAKLGYRQDGSDMICNKCGMRFPAHLINVKKGGCNPIPLEPTVEGEHLVLRASDLETGAGYF